MINSARSPTWSARPDERDPHARGRPRVRDRSDPDLVRRRTDEDVELRSARPGSPGHHAGHRRVISAEPRVRLSPSCPRDLCLGRRLR